MLLGAAAACVILLSFAARSRKSYWSGCIQAAIVICQQIFADFRNFCASNFPLVQNPFIVKSASNRLFSALASRSGFGAVIPAVIMYKKVSLCKNLFL